MGAPDLFKCSACNNKHCDVTGELPGSIGAAPFPIYVIADPAGAHLAPIIETNVCLLPMVSSDTWFLFRLYQHYKKGVLLHGGGIMDQPNRYIEIMESIDEALSHGN